MKNKYIIIGMIISIFLLLLITYFVIQDKRKLSIPEKLIKDSVLVVENIISTPLRYGETKIKYWKESKKTEQALKNQENKIKAYDRLESELTETKKRVKELENMLEIKNNQSDYTSISATVMNRKVGAWYNNLTIDKGSKDGVEEGDAVITSYGLIGKIIKVTNYSSNVKLLTSVNENFQISVKIESETESIYGLLSNYKDDYLIISGISNNKEIPTYSKVVTTGLDNRFPSGILIGYTEKEEKDNFDLARTIYVSPAHSLDDITYVSVLKKVEK
jgi:rod shape-determining protein mreC